MRLITKTCITISY